MVGFCHGGNMLGNHHHQHHPNDDRQDENVVGWFHWEKVVLPRGSWNGRAGLFHQSLKQTQRDTVQQDFDKYKAYTGEILLLRNDKYILECCLCLIFKNLNKLFLPLCPQHAVM